MCGTWSGPDDGDASKVITQVCEECQPHCVRCGSIEIDNDDVDHPLCLGCYSAEGDRIYEERRDEADHAA